MEYSLLARRILVVAVIVACSGLVGCMTTDPLSEPVTAESLLGTWKVDLRPTPDAEPYYQELVVTAVDGNSFAGTFYGAPVSQARINADWGKIRIAFVTADGSGPYAHSAVLEDDRLEGLSNSTGRDFLSYWSAQKQ